jgi:predicted dehydrogenase
VRPAPLRVAVVGAGRMGRLHAEKCAELRDRGEALALSGIADVDLARARGVAARTGAPPVSDYRRLLSRSDAAIVAVPTALHYPVVREALAAGCDVLVEKPIAAELGEAEDLLKLARGEGRILQVGHLEWYNGALRSIQRLVRRPRFAEAHRLGPFPERAGDVDVVRDLMIHDLDILQRLLGEEPCRVEAIGVPVLSSSVDIANARVTFPGGCVANLTASRVTPKPLRKLRFFQRDGYFSIDFLEQSAVVFRREEGGGAPAIRMQRLDVSPADALLAQMRDFLEAVRTRRPAAEGGPDSLGGALGALRTALRVIDAMPPIDELE